MFYSDYLPERPKIALEDLIIISNAIQLCNEGYSFYRFAITQADDQIIKNFYRSMANAKQHLVEELTYECSMEQLSELNGDNNQWTFISIARNCYHELSLALNTESQSEAIHQMTHLEQQVLERLKKATQSLKHPALAQLLASRVASIQMTHDNLAELITD
jgi:heme oxygenase